MPAFTNPQAYENWMGRWSARLAPDFVRFAGIGDGNRILDIGAGTGVLGKTIGTMFPKAEVLGVEPSEAYVAHARAMHTDPRLTFHVGDAVALPVADGAFDAALALLVLQELSDIGQAAREMRRATRTGGIVAACQWDFGGGLPMTSLFWNTVYEVYPVARTHDEAIHRMPRGCADTEALARLWTEAGMQAVDTTRLTIDMEFAGFDDYWEPFLSNATPTSSYAGTLPATVRQVVAASLRERLIGDGADRPFTLTATALAVRGTAL